ncbi:MAG: hypothetical protein C0402_13650 [Thermodesulfovibrio sp.]|nr:hypothetical protein [Thermodesulfovibrio sp.]
MNDNEKLTRQWQERAMWLLFALASLYFLAHYILNGAPIFRIVLFSIYFSFAAWGAFVALTKPDVIIKDNTLHLFGRFTPQPSVITLGDIQYIQRRSGPPIWRVQPLLFYLKNGKTLTFSTGLNESRMKRIIKFIESQTALNIKTT